MMNIFQTVTLRSGVVSKYSYGITASMEDVYTNISYNFLTGLSWQGQLNRILYSNTLDINKMVVCRTFCSGRFFPEPWGNRPYAICMCRIL